MKNLSKFSSAVLMLLMGFISNAQFNHDFSSGTSIQTFGSNWVTENPGCFIKYSGGSYYYAYDANVDGVKSTTGGNLYLYLPVLSYQGNFEIEIEYTASSSFDVWTNFANSSGWDYSKGATVSGVPASPTNGRGTFTVRTGNVTGAYRTLVYCQLAGVIVHSVSVTNVTYSPGQGCSVTNLPTCTDTDADGVCDSSDDYPNDPTKAYGATVPATTFMYEDLYPAYGDFDFNDLVVSTVREVITDADNTLRYLVVEAQVKASGASIAQGWGLELKGINPSSVVSVSGSNTASGIMSLGANGTENGQTNVVVPIFDNSNKVITRAGGPFFNTVAADPAGTGETIEVVIEFDKNSNLTVNDLDYNFFAFRTNSRGHEIHEIGNTPTNLANQALFGTGMDNSDVNSNQYYVSVDGFPWAISSVGTDYAVEKVDIVQAFLKFAGWAQSGGTMHQDWHTNTTEGTYRNSAKIY